MRFSLSYPRDPHGTYWSVAHEHLRKILGRLGIASNSAARRTLVYMTNSVGEPGRVVVGQGRELLRDGRDNASVPVANRGDGSPGTRIQDSVGNRMRRFPKLLHVEDLLATVVQLKPRPLRSDDQLRASTVQVPVQEVGFSVYDGRRRHDSEDGLGKEREPGGQVVRVARDARCRSDPVSRQFGAESRGFRYRWETWIR